MLFIAEI